METTQGHTTDRLSPAGDDADLDTKGHGILFLIAHNGGEHRVEAIPESFRRDPEETDEDFTRMDALVAMGAIEYGEHNQDRVHITDVGREILNAYEPVPHDHILGQE